jgi:hypothetical protein
LHCLSLRCPLVLSLCRPLILLLSSDCATLLLSHLTGWLLCCLLMHCPLVVLSLNRSLVVSHQLVVALPLVVPPSHPLVVPPSHPLVVLSLRHPLIVSSHQLVVALSLAALPSCRPLTLPLSCHLAPAACCIASCCATLSLCHPLVLSLSSHCAAHLLSHLTGMLLHRLSLHRPLIVLSRRCSFVVLRQLVVVLPLVVPPSRPPVVLYLKLIEPGFPNPFDMIFVVPRERSSRTSPTWPLAHARWSHCHYQTSSMNQMSLTSPCLMQLHSSPNVSARSTS